MSWKVLSLLFSVNIYWNIIVSICTIFNVIEIKVDKFCVEDICFKYFKRKSISLEHDKVSFIIKISVYELWIVYQNASCIHRMIEKAKIVLINPSKHLLMRNWFIINGREKKFDVFSISLVSFLRKNIKL